MNILICGFAGKMGQTIYNLSKRYKNLTVTEGLVLPEMLNDYKDKYEGVSIISNINESKNADCVIDFSFHTVTKEVLDFCVAKKIPLVLGTTGHTEEELKFISEASKKVAIFKSNNMSVGVHILNELIREATKRLYDWDIEIIEKHHNMKADAPSGTARMMLESVKDVKKDINVVIGRNEGYSKRQPNEVTVHSIRGGGYVGEHEIEFISDSEVIKITHEAFSKEVFADGALKASLFLKDKQAGLYNMKNLF